VSSLFTDAAALQRRLHAHDRFASRDINEWILGLLSPAPGERVLDLGCGTGRQALALASRGTTVVGLDVSDAALAEARKAAAQAGLSNVRFVCGRLEALATSLAAEEPFDAALCSFALYYAAAPEATLRGLRGHLSPGGRVLVCGPARENNQAFVELCESVIPRRDQPHRMDASLTFMDVEAPDLFRAVFERVTFSRFENPLTFPRPEDVLDYWRSYHLYSPAHEQAFQQAVAERFAGRSGFTTVKVVTGALLS
jgi:SAM-dependent methyltransferase